LPPTGVGEAVGDVVGDTVGDGVADRDAVEDGDGRTAGDGVAAGEGAQPPTRKASATAQVERRCRSVNREPLGFRT